MGWVWCLRFPSQGEFHRHRYPKVVCPSHAFICMTVSRIPFRNSILGHGIDYRASPRAALINIAFSGAATYRRFSNIGDRVIYYFVEIPNSPDNIQHPAVREVLRYMQLPHGVEIYYDGDFPSCSGMGFSSAFTVGVLHALHGLKTAVPGKHQLVLEGTGSNRKF